MKKKKILIIAGIAILIILVILAFMFFGKKKNSFESAMSSANAQKMTIEQTISSDGEITSSLEENITPHTSYYLKKIVVSEGDAVKEGDTILKYTNGSKMKAPYDCVVESWYLPKAGKQLKSSHYVTLAGTDVLQIELSVSEDEVSKLKEGDSAEVTVGATSKTYKGEVSYVSQVGDYSGGTSTFTAKVTFNNNGKIKLGMTGEAKIILDKAENVIGVPSDAVHVSGSEYYVTVQNGKETEERQVTTGISNDSYTEIKEGLNEGETVIVPQSDDDNSFGPGNMQMPGGGDFPGGGNFPNGGGAPGGNNSGGGSSSGGGMPGGQSK